jgi:RNase P/RNase MRP subunit p30
MEFTEPEYFLTFLKKLHFDSVIIESKEDKLSNIEATGSQTRIRNQDGDFFKYSRKTLKDQGKKHLNKNSIDTWREKCHFLVQKCNTAEITKWATQDQRIDAITFNFAEINSLFDLSTARLMKENEKFLEISLKDLFFFPGSLIKNTRNLLKALKKAKTKEVPLVFSSFASSIYDIFGFSELKGVLNYLKIDEIYYFDFSQLKLSLRLKRNEERFEQQFISPGMKKIIK